EYQKAEACVTRFSYKCDSSRMGRVGWMWRSVSRSAQRTCEQQQRVSICDDQMDPDHAKCDLRKAKKCSVKQYRTFINPFIRKSKKCRYLSKNMECIQTYTRNCNGTKMPKMFMLDPDQVEDIQKKLRCQEEEMDNTFGCRSGCMIDSAQECLATFQKSMTDNMWGLMSSKTCGMINDMRFCVGKHTQRCRIKEKRGVLRAVDKLLERFPKHHEACVDVATCTADFDALVRQIEGLRTDDDADYPDEVYGSSSETEDKDKKQNTKDKDKKPDTADKDKKPDTGDKDKKPDTGDKDKKPDTGDKDKKPDTGDKDKKPETGDKDKKPETGDKDKKPDTGDKDDMTSDKDDENKKDKYDDDKDKRPAGPSLEALCNRIRILWNTCVKPGFKLLPSEKASTAMAMYKSIWAAVEEKCQDTTQLTCYMCKNRNETSECEMETQVCPHSKKACLFKQSVVGDEIRYSAYCANPRSCYNDGDGNTQKSCCYGDLCNTASDVSLTPITQEPETCKFEYALKCALDFTMSYISTDDISCRRTTQRLSCVQRFGQTCTSEAGKSLVQATNSVFLELASTRCVVDSQPGDCFSLAIFSMQSILSNAYVSDGNTPCVGLQETEASVAQTIANGNCTEAGRISLEASMAFVRNIVGPHCEPGSCEAVSWADVISGDGTCSGQIFKGIKYIYKGYSEMAKSDSDCGLLTSYVEEARNLLGNCKMVAFLKSKLEQLESRVQQRCGQAISASLPPVCVGTCQTDVVIQYVRNLRTVFDNTTDSNAICINLMQAQRVYNVYTKECTSVQQKDVVKFVKLSLRSEIESCDENESSFDFDLELKRDIYYEAVECQVDFQSEVAAAFKEGSQERMCKAVQDLEGCQYELPNVFENFIMGQTSDLLALIDSTGLCDGNIGGQNTSAPRQKRAACDIDLLATLVQQLLIPPNIATSSFESRDLFCQETASSYDQAKSIKEACGNTLNFFQLTLFNLMKTTVDKNNEQLCPPLRFEEEGCNLNLINSCFKDFFIVLKYANIGTQSVCRQARFSLDCMTRFTETCKSAQQNKAKAIRAVAVRMVKDVVVNKCPGLVQYLFCNGDLSEVSAGCQLKKAQQCAAESRPELSERFTEGYCESKQEKVDCAKQNLQGCTDQQITSVTLPAAQLDSICGISNTSLGGVCRSDPPCPLDEIKACFNNSDECASQSNTIKCIGRLNANYPRCLQSMGSDIEKLFYLQYRKADLTRCGLSINFTPNSVSKSLCVTEALNTINSLLSGATATADQVLANTITAVTGCLSGKDTSINLDVGALEKSLMYLNETLTNDNGTCSYSKAVACVGKKINSLIFVKLLNIDERNRFCRLYSEDKVGDCLKKHLASCPENRKTWFDSVNTRVDKAIDDLGVCKPPQTCIVSEAFACINKFGTVISQFDRSQDKVALCT
ncbi:collagen-like protein 7, partial [Elysia marginata]